MTADFPRYPRELRHGSGARLTLEPAIVLIVLDQPRDAREIQDALAAIGATLVTADPARSGSRAKPLVINHTRTRFWCRLPESESPNDQIVPAIERAVRARVRWVGPVYRTAGRPSLGALICPLPDVLLLRFEQKTHEPGPHVLHRLAAMGLEHVAEKSRYLVPFCYFMIPNLARGTAYDLRERVLTADLGVVDVRYETMPLVVPFTSLPDDPLLPLQWNMTQTGATTPGSGWHLSAGHQTVVVCILDSGCDLGHPDLRFASLGINLGSMAGDASPTGSLPPHGTACAGIATGVFDNGVGVAGVAGQCVILPLALENVTDAEVAAGIQFAAANGAHVISMSFGNFPADEGLDPSGWDFAPIDEAIELAFRAGLVLAAASGNQDLATHLLYPARHPLVMAVGASDEIDNRKSPASPDGEDFGSNFGPGVSVVAPGVRIPTTDQRGSAGFATASGAAGDFMTTFNGTSAATPHVAGLAALIRSTCPTRSNVDIRNIIERTAHKVGVIAYDTQPGFANGTRNNQMGYGRISVAGAVREAVLFTLACLP